MRELIKHFVALGVCPDVLHENSPAYFPGAFDLAAQQQRAPADKHDAPGFQLKLVFPQSVEQIRDKLPRQILYERHNIRADHRLLSHQDRAA